MPPLRVRDILFFVLHDRSPMCYLSGAVCCLAGGITYDVIPFFSGCLVYAGTGINGEWRCKSFPCRYGLARKTGNHEVTEALALARGFRSFSF